VTDTSAILIGQRYRIVREIGKGGMGVVYRAIDRLNGQPVALKRVTAQPENLLFASQIDYTATLAATQSIDATRAAPRLALANEFKLLASLRHPHIISVLDYGFDADQQPFFTMDLLEDAQTILEAAQNQSRVFQVELIIQCLQALRYLHRRGILHRDLKPGNIFVRDGSVKVLDFGLSVTRTDAMRTTSGTLAYMAPELIRGGMASEASDLYALGMIALEVFNGSYPYPTNNVHNLIDAILNQVIDVPLPDRSLAATISRLLAKDPAERYSDAADVITALRASSAPNSSANHVDTPQTRESFLQAARFIGREPEIEQLTKALHNALQGTGNAWLIGGESGVGKTRLVEEMRARALIAGAVVLQGQSVSEGRTSYQLWREPLRLLVLLTELTPQEASTLKTLVPDIAALIERDVEDAEELDTQAMQARLIAVVRDVIQRVPVPLVCLLEDIQWAGEESLALLASLIRFAPSQRLHIVGTYRDDERPDLPELLPPINMIKLHRLPPEQIQQLSESIIGTVAGDPTVMALLRRESDGNVYLLVEVIRALAEEQGGLENIGTKTLPEEVFSGGIQKILERRLARVPAWAAGLLRAAAVQGRALDLPVLRRIDPAINLDHWLEACSDVWVLAVQDGVWRFAHDKLRERLIASIPELPALHRSIAQAIESVHIGNSEYHAALAHHYQMAGDAAKERHYARLTGEEKFASNAWGDAVHFFSRVLALTPQGETLIRATLQRQIGQAWLMLGNLPNADAALKDAVNTLQIAAPTEGRPLRLNILKQIGIQAKHRLFRPRRTQDAAHMLEVARLYEQLALRYYWENQKFPAFHAAVANLNATERVAASRELVRAYANATVAAGVIRAHGLARTYAKLVWETGAKIDHPPTLATALRVIQAYFVGVGDWAEELHIHQTAYSIAERYNDLRVMGDTSANHQAVLRTRGMFAECVQMETRVRALYEKTGNLQFRNWSYGNQLIRSIYGGDTETCAELMHDLFIREQPAMDAGAQITVLGPMAMAMLQMGREDVALQYAEESLRLMSASPSVLSNALEGHALTCEALLLLRERQPQNSKLIEATRQAVQHMRTYARTFKIGRPRAAMYGGWLAWCDGDAEKGRKEGKAAHELAQKAGIPFDEGRALYQLARHLPPGAEREALLNQSLAILEKLGAGYYVRLIEMV
jgi:eukaryotic-like serine/threonine-protein kinase